MGEPGTRSPLAQARGLGSARQGVKAWWWERVTAVALVPLMLWLSASLIALRGRDYAAVVAWLQEPTAALLLVLSLLALFAHLALGLSVVIEDYVHSFAKMPSLILARLLCVALCVAGVLATLSIYFRG
ncbi:MAG TPA: succinate dehydrogenase, hydrophobic membrane anchor protein [Gammaproteobacteria bacterium]|nr:succinate dehydrogenase, hydrophobic membrane anchor protein [Gammaproteobacteria bacterium]